MQSRTLASFVCALSIVSCTGDGGAFLLEPETGLDPESTLEPHAAVRAAAVSDLSVSSATETTVTLRWTQVGDGLGEPAWYRLKYAAPPLADWKHATIGCPRTLEGSEIGAAMECTVEGLAAGATYDFQLMSYRLVDGRWMGAVYSNVATGTTAPGVPGAGTVVRDLEVVAATSTTLTLRWTQVDDGTGSPASYRVRYGSPLVTWKEGAIGCARTIPGSEIGAETTCTVEGLEPAVTYDLRLYSFRVENGAWAGARPSNLVSGTTTEGVAGSRIAFASDRDGGDDGEIYLMDPDGTQLTRLTNSPRRDIDPYWSPDGRRIVFDSERDFNDEVYVMNADGSGQANLTNSNLSSDGGPAWSPDGSSIAFVSDRDFEEIGEIWIMNADGTDPRRLTSHRLMNGGEGAYEPDWSPDGSRIVFTGNLDVWIMNADGSGQTNLTNRGGVDQSPAWSPDGAKIAFSSDRDGQLDVYVMNADGTNPVRLTRDAASDLSPTWSPDGRQMAFQTDRDGNWEVYVMNADGSDQTNLTNHEAFDGLPAWSP